MTEYPKQGDVFFPGSVIPHPTHDGEWTFYIFKNGVMIYDADANPGRSYNSAAAAKQAMRDTIEHARSIATQENS